MIINKNALQKVLMPALTAMLVLSTIGALAAQRAAKKQYQRGQVITVGQLKALLRNTPDDLPVKIQLIKHVDVGNKIFKGSDGAAFEAGIQVSDSGNSYVLTGADSEVRAKYAEIE